MVSESEYTAEQYIDDLLKHGSIDQRAAAIAAKYGYIEGAHHKQWIIDQMLRLICGEAYATIVEAYEKCHSQKWDVGIAA